MNDQATLLAEYSFDAWGARRNASDWSPVTDNSSLITDLQTDRGFTGHEQLAHLGLVHMNGRIYDAALGRFLSADPHVQAPGDLQSYNRYTDVNNNPLRFTDPTGYFSFGKFFKKWSGWNSIKKYWKMIVVIVIAVVVTVLTAGALSWAMFGMAFADLTAGAAFVVGGIAGAVGGFVGGFAGTLLNGGSLSQAFKAGLEGAAWGAVGGAAGGWVQAAKWANICKALAQGVTGSAINLAQGGSWESGFLAGVAGGMAAGQFNSIGGKMFAGAIVGGCASMIGGGKFESGAVAGAFVALASHLVDLHYNRDQNSKKFWEEEAGVDYDAEFDPLDKFGDYSKNGSGSYMEVTKNNAHQQFNKDILKITTRPSGWSKWNMTGHQEIVLIKNQASGLYRVDTHIISKGTYNYGRNWVTHTALDVAPQLVLGNALGTSTTFVSRTAALLGGHGHYQRAVRWGF